MKSIIITIAAVLSFATLTQANEFIPESTRYNLVITVPQRSAVVPFADRNSCEAFRKFWLAAHYTNPNLLKRMLIDVQCVPEQLDSRVVVFEAEED